MEMENRHSNKTAYQAKRNRNIVLLLCLIAACRIFLFNAAFPLFNNVDEELHFDLVYKYSEGQLPRAEVEDFSREAVELILLYKTPEYFFRAEQFPGGSFPRPRWTQPNERESKQFVEAVAMWLNTNKNYETGSFPVYYIVAGIWCSAGRALGVTGGQLLYWIRFLNIPLFTVLVWFSYRVAQVCFPERSLQQIALPLIVAFFPQDAFYSINSDVISPLFFAISFFLLLQIYFESKSYFHYFLAGIVVAATLLTKISNIAVLVLLGVIVILKIKKVIGEKMVKEYIPRLVILLAAAAIPVGIWLIRNSIVLGDLTGTAGKIKLLRWTAKPLSDLWDHPIFTPGGLFYFLSELTKTFWRGEFVWHLEPIASWGTDLFYLVSSAVFIIACGLGVIMSRNKANQRYRLVLVMSFLVVSVSVLLLAVLSTLYNFNDSWYPSWLKPYFVSGRLISCVLLPFLLIYIDGLERIFQRLGNRVVLLTIVAIVIGITLSELWLTANVFASPYNWFGLR
jgi:hypothetical protein